MFSMTVSISEIKMDLDIEIGSPSGMGQLIRYFEIQSQRLDRQSLVSSQSATSCLNSQFESMIKFDRVPILAPAMTASRREALKQHKKDAILLEKKLKLRQRRQHKIDRADGLQALPSKHPSSPNRSAVRQLNFDAGNSQQDPGSSPSTLRQRLGATNPLSTFATADLDPNNAEDFGLRTMDSVNSDLMSMEESHLPTQFSGHTLKSLKEQKISYNLDHLCKELNVQDLGSTSGSDLSDALANTRELLLGNIDVARGEKWAQKVTDQRIGQEGDAQGLSFCHESQETVVEVSPESGSDLVNQGADYSSTSGFVEKTSQSSTNFEQTQTSIGSSPGCGSACTSDSQKSKVHFASFILEYNTSASQSLESTTVVKKKMSPSELRESMESDGVTVEETEINQYDTRRSHSSPHVKTAETKGKITVTRKISDEGVISGGLLNRVSLQNDSESSPTTPPYDSTSTVPFQSYGSSDACNSDKENDGSRIARHHHEHSSRHAVDHASRHRGQANIGESSPDPHHHNSHKSRVKRVSSDGSDRGDGSSSISSGSGSSNSRQKHYSPSPPSTTTIASSSTASDMKSYATGGMGAAISHTSLPSTSSSVSVGASQLTAISSLDSENLVSISQVSLGLHTSGVGSATNQQSVSDSQTSSARSTTLTGTSGSSGSTIKDDLAPKNVAASLGMNIIEGGNGHVQLQARNKDNDDGSKDMNNINNDGLRSAKSSNSNSHEVKDNNLASNISPKRLNTANQGKEFDGKEKDEGGVKTTPKQSYHVRRGSYTLSHPSPALLQARGKLEVGEEDKEKCEDDDKEKSSVSSGDENITAAKDDDNTLKKNLDFNELIQDLEESSLNHDKYNSNNSKDVFNNSNVPSDPEKDGKAEHINKYLRHVQFQNSMNLQSLDPEQSLDIGGAETDHHQHVLDDDEDYIDPPNNLNSYNSETGGDMPGDEHILSVLQSIADSQSSVSRLSDLEVQTLHQRQMELARQALVEQQRKDMEELFVQQRREIMKFESEIRTAQEQSLEQHNFLLQNVPENLKVKARHHQDEYSPENTGNFNSGGSYNINYNIRNQQQQQQQQPNTLSSINSVDNMRPQSMNRLSFNEHLSGGYPSLNLQPKSYPSTTRNSSKSQSSIGGGGGGGGSRRAGVNSSMMSNKSEAVSSDQDYLQQSNMKRPMEGVHHHHRPHNVPSLNPSDLDVGYTIPEFGSPSVSSPRMHRRIGINYAEAHSRRNGPVHVPSQAYHPEMKVKFERVSAVAKGFLTRCLMRSDKVQDLLKTIKDTREFFVNFQTETPIKKGNITSQDKSLMERIQAQLQGAKFDIHEIFFDLSPDERMALIEQTRAKEYVKKVKSSRDSTDVSRVSGPRMSQATLKALERKRKAREAEAIAILSTVGTSHNSSVSRSKTGGSSSNNSSPRCQNHTEGRALKPLQGQQSHQQHHQSATSNRSNSSISNNKSKEKKDNKPQPALPEKQQLTRPKRITIQSSKQSTHSQVAGDTDSGLNKATASTTAKVITKSKVVPTSNSSNSSKPASRPTKSWR